MITSKGKPDDPVVTEELIDYLNHKFPDALPRGPQATLEVLYERIGWRRVVEHLARLKRKQERTDLPTNHVHT